MRVLVTGSRNLPDKRIVAEALVDLADSWGEIVVVHGDCPTGADRIASEVARSDYRMTEEAHPADWKKHGRAAGPIRNQKMVDLGADRCLAFLYGDSRGTRDCARRAEEAGIYVTYYVGKDTTNE